MCAAKLIKTFLPTVGVLVMKLVAACAHGGVSLSTTDSFVATIGAGPGAEWVPGKEGCFCETTEMMVATPSAHYDEC